MGWSVYALKDPGTQEIRYIGCTNYLPDRVREHLHGLKGTTGKDAWIAALRDRQAQPTVEVLEIGTSNDRMAVEQKWIAWARAQGNKLINMNSGGGGRAIVSYPCSWCSELFGARALRYHLTYCQSRIIVKQEKTK